MQRMQLRNGKKKIPLLATVPMLGINTATAVGFERDEGKGNANKSSAEDVRALCKKGRLKQALRIFHVMEQPVDCYTYVLLLQLCIKKEAFSEAKSVHTHMNERGFTGTTLLGNTLLNMYAKCGNLMDARRVFDEMNERDVCSWTVMIAGYSRAGLVWDAMDMFHQMQSTAIQPNQFTFASVLQACAKLETLQEGMDVHRHIITGGFQSDVIAESALVDMYAKCGSLDDARQVFDKMHSRDVVSWNTMIAGYAQNGDFDEALYLFHKMPEPDLVSWNTMIAGYAQNRCAKEALNLFKQMQLKGLKSNPKTYASVLQACADLASLEQGLQIHGDASRSGFQSDIFVESALVDMYAKSGNIEKARDLFDRMHQRNAISWTAMIGGYAMHGYAKEALQLFEQMQYSGINPNHVTMLCVLSACCHTGLVKEGWRYFDCMSQCYNITPAIEHYVCMVDLLARSGHLDEAWDFIHKMPIKPNATVWRSLLGACRIHDNVELGKCVAEHLFELDPDNATPYVLLSNIYAATGRWDNTEHVRRMMRDRKLKKIPGCSWIEINKHVHVFVAGDRLHPEMQKIYAQLEELFEHMKVAGYAPDMRFALHDLEHYYGIHPMQHQDEVDNCIQASRR